MQRLEVSGAVRPIYGSLGVKRLTKIFIYCQSLFLTIEKFKSLIRNAHRADFMLSGV